MSSFFKKGFTLIELMMVMLLMAIITTITASGSFGMSRAAAYSAAQDVVYNTLQAAKQRACLDGKRVFVVFQDKDTILIVEGAGSITKVLATGFSDRTAALEISSAGNSGVTVWNLSTTTGVHARNVIASVRGNSGTEKIPGLDTDIYPKSFSYEYEQCVITPRGDANNKDDPGNFNKSDWKEGDVYGFEVMPAKKMPKGFEIGFNGISNEPKNSILYFNPDGTSGNCTVYIYEKIAKDETKAVKITVNNGIISFRNPKGN